MDGLGKKEKCPAGLAPEGERVRTSTRRKGLKGNYLDGATYGGWLGAGAALGPQEAAMRAAAAAMKASFMVSSSGFWVAAGMKRRPVSRQTSGAVPPCKAKDEPPVRLSTEGKL